MNATLKEMIRLGEGARIEFKKTLPQPERIAKTLVAFANTKGGSLLIGVQDDRNVVGIADAEEERFLLENALQSYCDPPVEVQIWEDIIHSKTVLLVDVAESLLKPHKAKNVHGEWVIYLRSGEECIAASPLEVKSLLLEKEGREVLKQRVLTKNETELFHYLDQKKKITLKDYAKLIDVSKHRADSILNSLARSGRIAKHQMGEAIYFTKS